MVSHFLLNFLFQFLFMRILVSILFLFVTLHAKAQDSAKKYIQPKDSYKLRTIGSPRISPEGDWILYTLRTVDTTKDKYKSQLFMIDAQGKGEPLALTHQTESTGAYQWSPDGKYISYLSKPGTEIKGGGAQIYLMDRRGGEPFQLTRIAAEIEAYQWRPDGKQLLLTIKEANTADTAATKIRKPFEIDRYHFKDDVNGYLDNRKTHLYLFDLSTKKLDTLTRGNKNEGSAQWAPDGKSVVYVSNITENPDRNSNTDIFQISTDSSRKIVQHTNFTGADGQPKISPDGKWLMYMESLSPGNFNMYVDNQPELWIKNLSTGERMQLSAGLDRPINEPTWSADSKSVYCIIEEDRKALPMQIDIATKTRKWLSTEEVAFASIDMNQKGQMIITKSDPQTPREVYAYKDGNFQRVTHIQKDWEKQFRKIYVRGFEFMSTDKVKVSGILYTPDSLPGKRPLILFIHGGPVAQDDYGYDITGHILAGAGYAVANVNYRGSSGRGLAFTKAIEANWGVKEVDDVVYAANYLVQQGWADVNRMGIGGWSYGGITANYTIAKDTRFKAAVSGAGSSLQTTMYGTDQYVLQYDEELGAPWKNPQKWIELSYPYFNVQKIKTPTLFMASEDDFNVPVAGAEQMYQAFKGAGIPTELVIYPGQHHGVAVPSYIVHRFNKHIGWFGKYLR